MSEQYFNKTLHTGTPYMIVVRHDFNGTRRQTIC